MKSNNVVCEEGCRPVATSTGPGEMHMMSGRDCVAHLSGHVDRSRRNTHDVMNGRDCVAHLNECGVVWCGAVAGCLASTREDRLKHFKTHVSWMVWLCAVSHVSTLNRGPVPYFRLISCSRSPREALIKAITKRRSLSAENC